ncbi:MAG: hypothetical protein J6M60_02535 [Clostridia bacterium]|nr:hypothetical protein [Clostridia bacterium]
MNSNDLVLHLVDKYIAEKEKNFKLQNELKQQKQMQNKNTAKTDRHN